MSRPLTLRVGQTLGVWKILSYEGSRARYPNGRTDNFWTCQCLDCGKICSRSTALLKGKYKGCRCGHIVPDASFHRAFRTYTRQARTRNLEFTVSLEDFKLLVVKPCYYCGKEPELNSYSSDSKIRVPMNGIDRINSDLSYTIENCIPCCGTCNLAKLDSTQEDFVQWVRRVGDFQMSKLIRSVDQAPAEGKPGVPIPEEDLEEYEL